MSKPTNFHVPGVPLNGRVLVATILLAMAVPAAPGQVPSDSLFQGFEPVGDFTVEIDGQASSSGEVYRSQRAAALLVLARELPSPVLVMPGSGSVHTVHIMKIAKRSDGTIDLLADAVLGTVGQYEIVGTAVAFSVDGHRVELKERPPLLGWQEPGGLEAYDPYYGRLARAYSPNADVLAALKRQSAEVKVEVYFGSWCPFCKQYLPRLVRVAEAIEGSRIDMDLYGLPPRISDDPMSKKMNIKSVPTGVVFVAGKEVGRIQGEQWKAPEIALNQIIQK